MIGEGACTNANDLSALSNGSIKEILFQCAEPWTGDTQAAAQCLSELTGIGADCSSCYANMLACMFGPCDTECSNGNPNCTACLEAQCSLPFEECAGLKLID